MCLDENIGSIDEEVVANEEAAHIEREKSKVKLLEHFKAYV